MSININELLLSKFNNLMANQKDVEIPPKIYLDMESEALDWDEENMQLIVRFPVKDRYQNPLGMMQGGMIVAAIDNVFGPLSYLVAPPSLTMQLNTSFIKSVGPDQTYIDVNAKVDEINRRFLHMSARVHNAEGELIALSQASCMMLRGPRR